MFGQSNCADNIAYDDLREWLAMAERLGEVRTVKGANCEEEIGLAAEAVLRAEHGPCVVFEDIPGCPKGFRLLLNMFAGTRRNMTLGFPDHLTKWELSDAYREAYLQEQRIVPHVVVDDGPVFENVMMGDDVDVTIFPAPKWHEKDGGRYIGTGTYSITRDPEENWLNAGDLVPQQSDRGGPAADGRRTGRNGALPRRDAFRDDQAERRQCRRARRAGGLVPRGRRRAHAARDLDHAALSRTRGADRACRRPVRRLGLRVEICRGGR